MLKFSICLALVLSSAVSAQTVSLTFDDGLNPDLEARASIWNQQILDGLHFTKTTAMVFPALARVGGEAGKTLIANWSEQGHYVGNHTSLHRSLASKRITLAQFVQDVKEADSAFGKLPTWLPMLRFPYIKEGDTAEKRDGMRAWLKENNYRSAPVSIDGSDWYYNDIWLTLQDPAEANKRSSLEQEYIKHLLDRAQYYDALAKQVLGHSPKHVLLLHVNGINAATLTRFIAAFKASGWAICSPKEAFEDPLYAMLPNVLPAGESIVWSLAKQNGIKDLRYPAEDSVYEEPVLRAKGLLPIKR